MLNESSRQREYEADPWKGLHSLDDHCPKTRTDEEVVSTARGIIRASRMISRFTELQSFIIGRKNKIEELGAGDILIPSNYPAGTIFALDAETQAPKQRLESNIYLGMLTKFITGDAEIVTYRAMDLRSFNKESMLNMRVWNEKSYAVGQTTHIRYSKSSQVIFRIKSIEVYQQ